MGKRAYVFGDTGIANFNNQARVEGGYIFVKSPDTGTGGVIDAAKIRNPRKLLHGIEFVVERDGGPPAAFRVDGDPDRLVEHLNLARLVASARDHTDRGRQASVNGYLLEQIADEVDEEGGEHG